MKTTTKTPVDANKALDEAMTEADRKYWAEAEKTEKEMMGRRG